MTILVTTASEATARDEAAIASGIPSRALMQRAGAAAAAEITLRYPRRLERGVVIYAGPGKNGGDAWVVAAALAGVGVKVSVVQVGSMRAPDGIAERAHAQRLVPEGEGTGAEGVVVDGLLGTGVTGVPRGEIADAIGRIAARRAAGAHVVALDLPTGVDATTGSAEGSVVADLTLTFATMKRGLLIARAQCGRIVLLDIGLGAHGSAGGGSHTSDGGGSQASVGAGAVQLVDARWVYERIPSFEANSHKGTRRRVAVLGGGEGMAGASILAGRAAMRSGVGVVRLVVDPSNVVTVQSAAPEALARPWPDSEEAADDTFSEWPDVVLLGPGLGRTEKVRELVERTLHAWKGPVVLDADALHVYGNDTNLLARALGGRPAMITPHPGELSRLVGSSTQDVIADVFRVAAELAGKLNCVVLAKGVPTVIAAPDGRILVSAAGTPVLSAAGSGDVLGGIAATLIAQMDDPLSAAACAAWIHGRAGELASRRQIRGRELADVLEALPRAWRPPRIRMRAPVVTQLRAVGERRESA
jgi:ADP-dependent NAD(P)H-hydrate dehydratase / NAD(P)H-hydrate epimerase